LQVNGVNVAYVPHWPQAGLIPCNDVSRRLHRIGYMGRIDDADKFQRFGSKLRAAGFEFVVRGPAEWHNYSDLDAVVSLRFLSKIRIRRKPPTKLMNA